MVAAWRLSLPLFMRPLRGALRTEMKETQRTLTMQRNGEGEELGPLHLFYNDVYEVPLPDTHRFPMAKYQLARLRVQSRLTSHEATFAVSPLATRADLATTHCPGYVARFLEGRFTDRENRVVGFPWSEHSVRRTLSSTGGTVAAMHAVCGSSSGAAAGAAAAAGSGGGAVAAPLFAGQIAGGTHHAFYDRGEGFCVFSDIAVAANVALRDYPSLIRRVLIVDLDVHQGNGNAALHRGDDRVFTFSMHCRENYFSNKEESDVDVELDAGIGDDAYLAELAAWLPRLAERMQPDLVFFQAGVDPLHSDRLGRLSLTLEGLRRRNRLVYDWALRHRTRLVITMGGGYPRDMDPASAGFEEVVRAHADVYLDAADALATVRVAEAAADTNTES
ncbi:unnamed protein product [Phaeothamnion confervicola]